VEIDKGHNTLKFQPNKKNLININFIKLNLRKKKNYLKKNLIIKRFPLKYKVN
jgi:hypothetical protein